MGIGEASKPIQILRNNHASTAVTTSAYVELDSALNGDSSAIEIYDTSTKILVLAAGAAGSEVDLIYIPANGNGRIPLLLNAGTRLSVKAVDAATAAGNLLINLYG